MEELPTVEIMSEGLKRETGYFLVCPEDCDWFELFSVADYGVVSGPVVFRYGKIFRMLANSAWIKAGRPGLVKISASVLPGYELTHGQGLMLEEWVEKEDKRREKEACYGR